jgi:hypothetical protein
MRKEETKNLKNHKLGESEELSDLDDDSYYGE